MERSLSIPEWHRMAMEGAAPPVRIQLDGDSMYPLVRRNRDYVTVVPLQERLIAGDLVLFFDGNSERYIVHRVWEVKDGAVLTWGDSCAMPDGLISLDAVWGKIALVERGKHKFFPDPNKGLRWAKFWHRIRPIYMFYLRIRLAIGRRIKKLQM